MKQSVLVGVLFIGMNGSGSSAMWYRPPANNFAQENLFWKASVTGARVGEKQAQEKQEEKNLEEKDNYVQVLPMPDILPVSTPPISRMQGNLASKAYREPKEMSVKKRKLLFKSAVESGDATIMRVLLEAHSDFYLAEYSATAGQNNQTELSLVAQQFLRSRIAQDKQDLPNININFLACMAVIRVDCQAALAFLKAGAYLDALKNNLFSRQEVSMLEDGVRFSFLEQDVAQLKNQVSELADEVRQNELNSASSGRVTTLLSKRNWLKLLESESRRCSPLQYLIHKREFALGNVRPLFDTLIQELVCVGADFRKPTPYGTVLYFEAHEEVQQIITCAEQERDFRRMLLEGYVTPRDGSQSRGAVRAAGVEI